jgi:hypothetical protein
MATPLLEIEGTWEEIKANAPDFSGLRLHVIVLPVDEDVEMKQETGRPSRQFGLRRDAVRISDDFDAPLPDTFWLGEE